jgi:hypothetical protein
MSSARCWLGDRRRQPCQRLQQHSITRAQRRNGPDPITREVAGAPHWGRRLHALFEGSEFSLEFQTFILCFGGKLKLEL